MDIKIVKLTENAILPSQAHSGDAGYDLYAVDRVVLKPMARAVVKTGISIRIPFGYYGRVAPRSGLSVKNGIDVMAGVIDHSYTGEIGVVLINLNFNINQILNPIAQTFGSDMDFIINPGMKIAQLIIEKCHDVNWIQVDKLDETKRGDGGFGSTGS